MNKWIETNYHLLKKFAKHWSPDNWSDLISCYYIYLTKSNNWNRISALPHDEQMKWTQRWMSNSVRWANSDFNKAVRVNNLEDEYEITDGYDSEISIEIMAEDGDLPVKEWLLDLHEHWGPDQINRIVKIRHLYLSNRFTVTDRILFDMCYTNQMTMRQISEKISIPLTSVFLLVKDLENKIRTECGSYSIA